MNKKQIVSMWLGIIAFILPAAVQYYRFTYEKFYLFDFSPLIIQWLIVGAITTGFVLTFKDRKK